MMTQISSSDGSFPATRWSVVLAATNGPEDASKARAAWEELCRTYWLPLYAFARGWGCTPEDAEDATQEFLAGLCHNDTLGATSPEKGRLRSFLLASFRNDLVDARRHERRLKRGGPEGIRVPLDETMEGRFAAANVPGDSPESAYDRAWALASVASALARVEDEYRGSGREATFTLLGPFLDPESPGDYAEASAAAGLNPNALRQAVLRLRQRFRHHLRALVADTLAVPVDSLIDEELRVILASLAT